MPTSDGLILCRCLHCGWQLLQLWCYLWWMLGAPFPGAAQTAGLPTHVALLAAVRCMLVAVLSSHLMWGSSCWKRLQVGPSLCLEHSPCHSLTIRENTWSVSVLDVPRGSPGFSSSGIPDSSLVSVTSVQLTIHNSLHLYYLFHISATGFSHLHSGPCSYTS